MAASQNLPRRPLLADISALLDRHPGARLGAVVAPSPESDDVIEAAISFRNATIPSILSLAYSLVSHVVNAKRSCSCESCLAGLRAAEEAEAVLSRVVKKAGETHH